MRKTTLTAAALFALSAPLSAETLDICFTILDQPAIEAGGTSCEVVAEGTVISGQFAPQGPYLFPLEVDGELLCGAHQTAYSASQAPIYGEMTVEMVGLSPFPTLTLDRIAGNDATCN